MNVTVSSSDFRTLIGSACRVMDSSDLGKEISSGETQVAFWLRATDKALTLNTAVRGLEVCSTVDVLSCQEEGEVPINPFLLKRLSFKPSDVTLSGDLTRLRIKAGRFNSVVATLQGTKQAQYDEVPLTHALPTKLLCESLATAAMDQQNSRPVCRLVWTKKGLRVWSHNSCNAAYSIVLDEPVAGEDLSLLLPVDLILSAAASDPNHDIQIGMDRNCLRVRNTVVDISHPSQTSIELENIEDVVSGLDADSIPHFEINPASFMEALQAVGSVESGSGKQATIGVDLWVMPGKNRLVCAVQNSIGRTTHRVDLGPNNLVEDMQIKLNLRQLLAFLQRVKNQKIRFGLLPDRTIMWAGTAMFVLAPVQDEP